MSSSSKLAESKLIIMYMINKMGLPVSLAYIQEFALTAEYMDYFSLTKYLVELVESGYLVKNIENNKTIYALSKTGYKTLSLFSDMIVNTIKKNIDEYANNNKNKVQKDLDISANFTEENNEFNVNCGVYENAVPIMEISVKVSSKKYAKTICENWKKDASKYYLSFLKSLLEDSEN